ncbi:hypothetical protein [Sphingobium fuliginis]|uniref:Cupin domain-containing protein n=1 Tax=Sphingobium fuliginis ATCC 27551 TaxID=1208342 RepID=A0A5B8CCK1_SPHSA|nr:hypothetical protein [Sphingobium fuliginis]QDC37268.1 hypothetical protein FIL70_08580 [Sphingobium fuliginis ATCC 27551]
MIAQGRRSTSEATRRPRPYPGGQIAYKAEWMDTGQDPHFSPTVFLYEQPGDTTLSAHFHHNNQFQIFIEGEGKIGPRKVGPVVVHYAGAYTGYGPLQAAPAGLKYFTLRSVHESGAVRVADARAGKADWPKGPMRHATSKQIDIAATEALAALEGVRETILIPRADDGLEVVSIELPPTTALPAVDIGTGEGVFIFILAGSIDSEPFTLSANESLYISSDERFPRLMTGPSGGHLLTLVMPKRDPAFS